MDFSNKCWCCLQEKGRTGLTNLWYNDLVHGNPENYGQMLADCFDFNGPEWIKSKDNKICLKCVTRVRNAVWFKRDMFYLYGADGGVGTVDTLQLHSQDKTAYPTNENPEIDIKDDPDLCDEVNPDLYDVDPDFSDKVDLDFSDKVDPDLCDKVDPDLCYKVDPDLYDKVDPDLPNKVDPDLSDRVDPDLCDKDLDEHTETVIASAMKQYLTHIQEKQKKYAADDQMGRKENEAPKIHFKEEITTAHKKAIKDNTANKNTATKNLLKERHEATKNYNNATHFETVIISNAEENYPYNYTNNSFNVKDTHFETVIIPEAEENYLVERKTQESASNNVGINEEESLRYDDVFTDYEYLIPIENKSKRGPLRDKLQVKSVLDAIIRNEMTLKQAAYKLHTNVQTIINMLHKIGYMRKQVKRQATIKKRAKRSVPKRCTVTFDQLEKVMEDLKNNRISMDEAVVRVKLHRQTLKKKLTEYIVLGYLPRTTTTLGKITKRIRKIFEDVVNDRMSMVAAAANLNCTKQELHRKLLKEYGYSSKKARDERMSDLMRESKAILAYTSATPIRVHIKRYYCLYCPRPKDKHWNADELREHTRTQHADSNISEAKHYFEQQKYAIRLDITDLKCKICSFRFKMTWQEMFQHLERIHNLTFNQAKTKIIPYDLSPKAQLKCVLCRESFKQFEKLNLHMNNHYFEKFCQICNVVYKNSENLKMHTVRAHEEKGKFTCDHCSKTYTIKGHIIHHLQYCKGPALKSEKKDPTKRKKTKIIKCFQCYEKFENNSEKKEHLAKKHGITVTYPCTVCDQVFTLNKGLSTHYRRLHPNVKFECKICGQVFGKLHFLKRHEDWHSDQKAYTAYTCDICGEKFQSKNTLTMHKQTLGHNDHKYYTCKTCGEKFESKKCAIMHRRTHGADCKFCDAKFKYTGGRRKHWKSIHPAEWVAHLKSKGMADRVDTYLRTIQAKGERKRRIKYTKIVNTDSGAMNQATDSNYAPKDPNSAPKQRKNTDAVDKYKMLKADRGLPVNEHLYAKRPLAESSNPENPVAELGDPNAPLTKRINIDTIQNLESLNTTDHKLKQKISKRNFSPIIISSRQPFNLNQTFPRSVSGPSTGQYSFKIINSPSGNPCYVLCRSTTDVSSNDVQPANVDADMTNYVPKTIPSRDGNILTTESALPVPNIKQKKVVSGPILPMNQLNKSETNAIMNINMHGPPFQTKKHVVFVPKNVSNVGIAPRTVTYVTKPMGVSIPDTKCNLATSDGNIKTIIVRGNTKPNMVGYVPTSKTNTTGFDASTSNILGSVASTLNTKHKVIIVHKSTSKNSDRSGPSTKKANISISVPNTAPNMSISVPNTAPNMSISVPNTASNMSISVPNTASNMAVTSSKTSSSTQQKRMQFAVQVFSK